MMSYKRGLHNSEMKSKKKKKKESQSLFGDRYKKYTIWYNVLFIYLLINCHDKNTTGRKELEWIVIIYFTSLLKYYSYFMNYFVY